MPDFTLTARVALDHAIEHRKLVLAVLRGDPARGRGSRGIEGIPIGYRPSRDGRERVAFLMHGDAVQLVLVERIVAVISK